jgi:hypothetical protein
MTSGKGKSTLSLDWDFARQSDPALDRHWDLAGQVSALGSAAVGIQTISAQVLP